MAEPRNIRLRIIWPLLILIAAGSMWLTNRSHVAALNVSNEEVEQWVLDLVRGHLDGDAAPLPTVNDVLDRHLKGVLRTLEDPDGTHLTVRVSEGDHKSVRYASLMEGGEVRCILEVRQMDDGRLAISGVRANRAFD